MAQNTPLNQLRKILKSSQSIKLVPGLTEEHLHELTFSMPAQFIPHEVRELLMYSIGFEHNLSGLKVNFHPTENLYEDRLIGRGVKLVDQKQDSWVINIDQQGYWGQIFYIDHHSGAFIQKAKSLTDFLQLFETYFQTGMTADTNQSFKEFISSSSKTIWVKPIAHKEAVNLQDPIIKGFITKLPEDFSIIDLRQASNNSGFSLQNILYKTIKKHPTEAIWALQNTQEDKKQTSLNDLESHQRVEIQKKSFWQRLHLWFIKK